MSSRREQKSDALSLAPVQAALQAALNAWQQPASDHSPLHELRLFANALRRQNGNIPKATNQVLLQALTQLTVDYPEHAAVLQSRFLDHEKVEHGANRLNMSTATFHRKRTEGIPLLAETLLRMEHTERAAYQTRLVERLAPCAYTRLFGKNSQLNQLESVLLTPDAPWLIVIAGLGGIGKTTLADALVRRLIEACTFDEIGWVTAQQTIFNAGGSLTTIPQPTLTAQGLVEALTAQLVGTSFTGQQTSEEALTALVERLKESPHLIVIDNLETVLDVTSLLPTLRRLVNPSKILLTTRHSLTDEADLYHTVVPELSSTDALALIRQEAGVRNIPHVLAASDADLAPILATVGGNPLALRLVTGQLRIHSLPVVLDALLAARGKQAEALYSFIYRQSWELLDANARAVLVAMPLVSEQGGRFELLAATCDLPEADLRAALEHLVLFNLVDVRGDLQEQRYTIHSLTRAFLHEQVIRWQ
ncbi:MAG: NB-ARC domain-containing protein [Caldilineaceae bacterium]